MEAAHASAPSRTGRSHDSERKCLATGEVRAKNELIRFVVSPDNLVTPDLSQNLPGRGLWVTAERESLITAARKNLFSKAAKESVKVDADLVDQVAQLMRKRSLDFLGLARSAGVAVLGQPQVEAGLKAGKIALLLIADDATHVFDSRISLHTYRGFTRVELGAALGYDQIAYAGFQKHPLTEKLAAELTRLDKVAKPYSPSQTDSEKQ